MNESPSVILIDDENDLLKALRRLLKAEGFQVACHTSAADFLAAARPPALPTRRGAAAGPSRRR